jgi:photosystem II stability/assembly factor-like uncharacterized protein
MSDANRYWGYVALSATGQYQVALVNRSYLYVSVDFGNTWIPTSLTGNPGNNWGGLAISSSGQYITAIDSTYNGRIYVSLAIPAGTVDQYSYSLGKLNNAEGNLVLSNVGSSFTYSSSLLFKSTAISSTGQYQTGALYSSGSKIYTSTNYGVSWIASNSITGNWIKVSMSSTGKYQSAIYEINTNWDQDIYTSDDYGVNWTVRDSSRNWISISMSSSGQYQTAVVQAVIPAGIIGIVYNSIDYGVTWSLVPSMGNYNYYDVCVSSTGKYQYIVYNSGTIIVSSNYGNTFNKYVYVSGISYIYKIAVSSNTQYQTISTGYIYTSNDYGTSWVQKTTPGIKEWNSLSMSSSGQYQCIASSSYFTSMYLSIDYGTTWSPISNNSFWYGISISYTGQYIITSNSWSGLSLGVYTSTATVSISSFTFNLDNGTTFFITSFPPTANYSINFTITTLNTANTYLITVINKTSSVHQYYCNSVSINGTAVSSTRFLYTVRPSVITSSNALTGAVQTNQEFVMFYNTTAAAWFVLTNIKVFKAG